MYSNYKITDKPLSELTLLQYNAVLEITNQIIKYKQKNKPLVVI